LFEPRDIEPHISKNLASSRELDSPVPAQPECVRVLTQIRQHLDDAVDPKLGVVRPEHVATVRADSKLVIASRAVKVERGRGHLSCAIERNRQVSAVEPHTAAMSNGPDVKDDRTAGKDDRMLG
jgi:hypothetical protein